MLRNWVLGMARTTHVQTYAAGRNPGCKGSLVGETHRKLFSYQTMTPDSLHMEARAEKMNDARKLNRLGYHCLARSQVRTSWTIYKAAEISLPIKLWLQIFCTWS